MTPSRRLWLSRSLCALAACTALAATAQTGAVVKLLVGLPPGGGTDAMARALAKPRREALGAPVVVENKPGAGGQIAARSLKAAAADGHTFFVSNDHAITILPMVVKNPGHDSTRDLVPVAGFATFVYAFAVSGGTPAKSFDEYVAWVKSQDARSNVGIPAPASTPESLVQLIGKRHGIDLVAAPYRGSAPMMADMLGNRIAAGMCSVPGFTKNPQGRRAPGHAVRRAGLRRTRPQRARRHTVRRRVRARRHTESSAGARCAR